MFKTSSTVSHVVRVPEMLVIIVSHDTYTRIVCI